MGNHYIHVGSITNAMRGKALLESQGLKAHLQRNAHPDEGDGCGSRLLVVGDVARAERILRDKGVRIIRVSDAL